MKLFHATGSSLDWLTRGSVAALLKEEGGRGRDTEGEKERGT